MIKNILILVFCIVSFQKSLIAQHGNSAADNFHALQKLYYSQTVLYIAAHPDDENTRLLAYLANEKKCRTAYLSLTRGDGGQNLIGDEQGISLGVIRTQELLAARHIDGAEQYFTRAYDFGYSKSPEEAMRIWGHDEILEDVVKVIRYLKPEIIITRFPTTGEGGHGHHTASAILAGEAFEAAGDSSRFPNAGKPFKPTSLYWNTFNFGGNNTTRDDQKNVDIGGYNELLGISNGELAAESRSQHKSQGFGVPMQRGKSLEYFKLIKGIDQGYLFEPSTINTPIKERYFSAIDTILRGYNIQYPGMSVKPLISVYKKYGSYLNAYELNNLKAIIYKLAGLYAEAISTKNIIAQGDSLFVKYLFNSRSYVPVQNIRFKLFGNETSIAEKPFNENSTAAMALKLSDTTEVSQPIWLKDAMESGRFKNDGFDKDNYAGSPMHADLSMKIYDTTIDFQIPIQYKLVDPVKGEILQNTIISYPYYLNVSNQNILLQNGAVDKKIINISIQANIALNDSVEIGYVNKGRKIVYKGKLNIEAGNTFTIPVSLSAADFADNSENSIAFFMILLSSGNTYMQSVKKIEYDHIPTQYIHYTDKVKIIKTAWAINGKKVGYIDGAGDKIPEALVQLGYQVTHLTEKDIQPSILKQYDAIVTGVRAYNVHEWLQKKYTDLMQYVQQGGTLLVQYNTNNNLGKIQFPIGPYPFKIGRTRVTDEDAAPQFLIPSHPLLNTPNKISEKDFVHWVQERSIYQAEEIDSRYQMPLAFSDFGEKSSNGSLVYTDYGKGRFIYTGLVFFRQLPAGVPGSFRLLANLLAKKGLK